MKKLIFLALVGVFIGLVWLFPHSMLEPGELSEGHQRTGNDCFSCHQPFAGLPNSKCIACHAVADIGRDTLLDAQPTLFHEALGILECVACHSEHTGRNADLTMGGFEHGLVPTAIVEDCNRCHAKPTDALHNPLPNKCAACHYTQAWKPAREFDHALLSAASKEDCASCHQRPADALHERIKGNCASCHSTRAWKPATFDHTVLSSAEKSQCAACHQPPADAFHRGAKDNCASCHETNAWSPSTFDHSRYFRLDGDHNAKCATCHRTKDYSTYTCYGCHEHTLRNILSEHREEGFTNITDCVRCHRSGDEDDIRRDGRSGPDGKGARATQGREKDDD
ncbi:MAG: cytochrome c3 family protein [Flavobacteriales bacterium]|nr:cytochrome c3 family protein [Flavobacteriales bacterium]